MFGHSREHGLPVGRGAASTAGSLEPRRRPDDGPARAAPILGQLQQHDVVEARAVPALAGAWGDPRLLLAAARTTVEQGAAADGHGWALVDHVLCAGGPRRSRIRRCTRLLIRRLRWAARETSGLVGPSVSWVVTARTPSSVGVVTVSRR